MPPSALVGRFEILEIIGQGPLAIVYRAADRELGVEVALKVLPSWLYPDAQRRNVFLAACRQASRLSHPYLVHLLAADAAGAQPCFVSRLVEGTTLHRTLERRRERAVPYSLTEVVRIVTQVAVGLGLLEIGIPAHGLLSPRNIFVLPGHIKFADYHLAATLRRADLVEAYAPGARQSYLAPEVQLGHPLSPSADVFSLGMIAAELLLGRRVDGAVVDFSEERPDLPASLGELLTRALYFDPASRPKSPKALAAGMRRCLDDVCQGAQVTEAPASGAMPTRSGEPAPNEGGPRESTAAAPSVPSRAAPSTSEVPVWGADVQKYLRSRQQSY